MLSINNFNYFCASKFSTKIIREMKKIILIIMCLFVLACGNEPAVNAQTIKGNFLNKRQQGKELFLYRTEGNYKYKIDSVKINLDGSFIFNNKQYDLGYYKLALTNDKNIIEVILNPKESLVYFLAFSPFTIVSFSRVPNIFTLPMSFKCLHFTSVYTV